MQNLNENVEFVYNLVQSLDSKQIDTLYNIFLDKKLFFSKEEVYIYFNNNRDLIKKIMTEIYGDLIANIFDYALSVGEIYQLPPDDKYPISYKLLTCYEEKNFIKFITSYIALYNKRLIVMSLILVFAEINESGFANLINKLKNSL